MSNVVWLLQGNMNNRMALDAMRSALSANQYAHFCCDITPFESDIPETPGVAPTDTVICWGPSFVPRATTLDRYSPGIWFDEALFSWSAMKEHWGQHMMSGDGQVVAFHEAVSQLSDEPVFLRPNIDSKSFDGGLYSRTNPPVIRHGAATEFQVVMARSRMIESEWRFFIADGLIIGESSYRINSRPDISGHVPNEIRNFAASVAQEWGPSDVYCLDIGRAAEKIGVIEANCFNAARVYGADIIKLVQRVTEFTQLRYRR